MGCRGEVLTSSCWSSGEPSNQSETQFRVPPRAAGHIGREACNGRARGAAASSPGEDGFFMARFYADFAGIPNLNYC